MTVAEAKTELERVVEEARKLVVPSPEERQQVEQVCNQVLSILRQELPDRGYSDCEISVQGSIAKDTWLPENKDIDIFVIFPKSRPREDLENFVNVVIDIANKHGIQWILKYAQHPYVQLKIGGFEVDVVPCYRIERGEKPLTAADRTPLHTEYVLSKLGDNKQLRDDIRLFKRFLKCLNIYGAELKVEGFSGYLAELLVIYYGSFLNLVRDVASSWRPGDVVIDIEKHYQDVRAVKKLFRDAALIVVDPVDPMRNAAAAVSTESMSTLILGCKLLLHRPSIRFFQYPSLSLSKDVLERRLVPPAVLIVMPYPSEVVPDTMWGEAKRLARSLWNVFERYEFKPYDVQVWSDEKERVVIMVSLRELDLPEYELHEGPPVYRDEVLKFVDKYMSDPECTGPFIMQDRVYVVKRRKYNTVEKLLQAQLPQVAPKHLKRVVDKAQIIRIEKIEDVEKLDPELRQVVLQFLLKRPGWLVSVYAE